MSQHWGDEGDKKTIEGDWGMRVWVRLQQTGHRNVVERFTNGQVAKFRGQLMKVDEYGANCLGHSVRVCLKGIAGFGSPETVYSY